MVGSGRVSVATAAELSRANFADSGGTTPVAVQALASLGPLGAGGDHPQNQERDLHRWVKGLHSLDLETYDVEMELQVTGFNLFSSVSGPLKGLELRSLCLETA